MSALFALAKLQRIKASHRRRRNRAAGLFVQRYYDPILGRFLSVDPVQASDKGGSFNRYDYAANNPYKFTDPDGREFLAADPAQQTYFAGLMNSQTTEKFAFDSTGQLQATGIPTDNAHSSQTYTNSIKAGINASTKIYMQKKGSVMDQDGKRVNIDRHGGGTTVKVGNKDLGVIISGNSLQTRDASGGKITDTPADIVRHEIVGHAVPLATGPATGNAIVNDNATRKELNEPQLPADSSHTELQK